MFFYSWTIDFQAIIHLAPFETCAVPNDDGGFPLHAAPRSTHPPLNRSPPVNLSTSKLCRAHFPHQIRMDRCFSAPSSTPQFALTLYQVPSSIFLLLENIFVPEFPRFPCSWQLKLLHSTTLNSPSEQRAHEGWTMSSSCCFTKPMAKYDYSSMGPPNKTHLIWGKPEIFYRGAIFKRPFEHRLLYTGTE